MNCRISTLILLALSLLTLSLSAQEVTDSIQTIDSVVQTPPDVTPAMPLNLTVKDKPNDAGEAILLGWDISPDDNATLNKVKEYKIYRAESIDGPYVEISNKSAGNTADTDNGVETGKAYYYKISAVNFLRQNNQYVWLVESESDPVGPIRATAQWFNTGRLSAFIGIVLLCGAIIYYIQGAKGGKAFYIRKIAGIAEVENAVGRATEMGRSIYYVPGINDMDDVQTLASMTILGKVSEIAAANDTRIDVPVSRSMVMVTAKEIVKESYSKIGRPDAYQDDQVRYLTDDQFGYAAAIDGLFVREKPATVFLMGAFFAESLIMAETGNSIGAIQIAGTAQPAQLPFFVAACDYTLIGEEMFAASAYLSREPKLL
ncbi:MAG: DUF6754 domain-containing protein, partial [Candidatus Zixiibacteriota bacterium]